MVPTRELTVANHIHRLVIVADAHGWEVLEEEDALVISRVHRSDWHRVEMDVRLFDARAMRVGVADLAAR
jgi:hypothetical protein